MADRCLHISWQGVVPGREERALEVFNETVGYYGRLQQQGTIESFEVCLLDPNGGVDGYFELRGTRGHLAAVKADEEFRDRMADAQMITTGLSIAEGVCNEGVAREVERFQRAIAKVPQTA
jgi:hypothetical protein